MQKQLPLILFSLLLSTTLFAQKGSIAGKIVDAYDHSGATCVRVLITQDSCTIDSFLTGEDGLYSFKNLPEGMYTLVLKKDSMEDKSVPYIAIQSGQIARLNILAPSQSKVSYFNKNYNAEYSSDGVGTGESNARSVYSVGGESDIASTMSLKACEIVSYKTPLIDRDGYATGSTLVREDITKVPTRDINQMATMAGGVQYNQSTGEMHVRGARADANVYFIDGVKVRGSHELPRSSMDNMSIHTGGIPANYGDVLGGVISVETKQHPWTTYYGYDYNGDTRNNNATTSTGTTTSTPPPAPIQYDAHEYPTWEEYSVIYENDLMSVKENPLSTFSIDVDNASYSNVRRYINQNSLPPKDAVRVEEMINYFEYDYGIPTEDEPFSLDVEAAECPWNTSNQLVRIGLQGWQLPQEQRTPINLVFLVDVSGSMNNHNKLPLLVQSLNLLTEKLNEGDRIAIVTYAGNPGLALPSTTGDNTETIKTALRDLRSGGSTNGAAGIELAYQQAEEYFIEGGQNRIILCTDGDFNVGISSVDDLETLIAKKRETGVFLSVLGFGMGNYKDNRMETLADKGNGNYYYIDHLAEAKKVLVTELTGTLYTIAKDVKLQVIFNPDMVASYRLIGYENRLLAAEDFDDDTKDVGELGAGHTVTALYEVVPLSGNLSADLNLGTNHAETTNQNPLMDIRFRYKKPDGDVSKLIEKSVVPGTFNTSSNDFRFAASVAGYGMLLRESSFTSDLTWEMVENLAGNAIGTDKHGYRAEFLELIRKAAQIQYASTRPE